MKTFNINSKSPMKGGTLQSPEVQLILEQPNEIDKPSILQELVNNLLINKDNTQSDNCTNGKAIELITYPDNLIITLKSKINVLIRMPNAIRYKTSKV